jgi:hypothetical protein
MDYRKLFHICSPYGIYWQTVCIYIITVKSWFFLILFIKRYRYYTYLLRSFAFDITKQSIRIFLYIEVMLIPVPTK